MFHECSSRAKSSAFVHALKDFVVRPAASVTSTTSGSGFVSSRLHAQDVGHHPGGRRRSCRCRRHRRFGGGGPTRNKRTRDDDDGRTPHDLPRIRLLGAVPACRQKKDSARFPVTAAVTASGRHADESAIAPRGALSAMLVGWRASSCVLAHLRGSSRPRGGAGAEGGRVSGPSRLSHSFRPPVGTAAMQIRRRLQRPIRWPPQS